MAKKSMALIGQEEEGTDEDMLLRAMDMSGFK